MKYIYTFIFVFCSFLYGYDESMVDKCNNSFIPSCLSLLKQANKNNDSKNISLYKTKILDAMDTACKKDYHTCFVLSRMYEPNANNKLFQDIQKDEMSGKIIGKPALTLKKDKLDSMYVDENEIINIIKVAKDASKATKYQEKTISLLETACYNTDPQACLLANYFYKYGVGVAKNAPKSERLVELGLEFISRECMLNGGDICQVIDKYPQYREYVKNNAGKLERKCSDEDDWVSCYQASLHYTQDFYINPKAEYTTQNDYMDFIKSARLLQKACKIDNKTCKDTIFKFKNAKECIEDNNTKACANTQNSRVEFLALACNGGDLKSCYDMRHVPTFKDSKRYIKLLQRVCRGGIIESCVELSNVYKEGKIVPKNSEKALNFIQRACAWSMKSNTKGDYCYHAGIGYENGEFAKQDLEKSIEAYKFACEISDDNAGACERLGLLYETYKQNMQYALEWYQKACNKSINSTIGCMKVAQNYYDGKILEFNPEKSIKIYEDLLRNKENGEIYYNLAHIYSNRPNKQQENMVDIPYTDYSKAIGYYNKACKLGINKACDINILFPNFKQECKSGNLYSCYELASILELSQNNSNYKKYRKNFHIQDIIDESIGKDNKPKSAKETEQIAISNLYLQACKGNIKQACAKIYSNKKYMNDITFQESICFNLKKDLDVKQTCINFANNAMQQGKYRDAIRAIEDYKDEKSKYILEILTKAYFYNKDYKNVLDIYKFIYKNNIPNDYYYLAQMYEYGLGVKQDYNIAQNIYKISNTPNSYLGLAKMYEHGIGVTKSAFSAKEFYALACPLESKNKDEISSEACVANGKLYDSEGNFQTAQKYYYKACEIGYNGDMISCDNTK